MLSYICFGLGLAAIAVAIWRAIVNRHTANHCISCIMLGVFFSTFCMVLPTMWADDRSVAYVLLDALLYSFKTLGGRQSISQLAAIGLDPVCSAFYYIVTYTGAAAAPILTSSLIISSFGDMGERLRYALTCAKRCYVFSTLNEHSLALAEGLRARDGRKTLVFCNTKKVDKALITKAKKLGGITLHKPCEDFALRRTRIYEFFLIDENEDHNTTAAAALLQKHRDIAADRLTLNAFAESGANIQVIEQVAPETIKVRFVDEIALFCNHLLYEHPLYATADDTISVMLIGCGRTGLQMLKTVVWCGQMSSRKLKIRAYDKDAEKVEQAFYGMCPELEDGYDIRFIKADVASAAFYKQIAKSADATYVVIAMGDDELNITAADRVAAYFRQVHTDLENLPPIFARVRSGNKAATLAAGNKFLATRNITLFGNTEQIFADNTLFDTTLERLAFAVHLTYCGAIDEPVGSETFCKLRREFETCEYSRRSSMATALHIPAKLVDCGVLDTRSGALTEAAAAAFEAKLTDELLEEMAQQEHLRWNAFLRSEGYRQASIEEMLAYAEKVGNQKDETSKRHPCLTDWTKLDAIQEAYNEHMHANKNFKKSDRDIIRCIPRIIRLALRNDV